MIEIAEAINNLATAVNSLGAGLVTLGIFFLFFKNMGGQK